jgi:uncharacterized protein YPO0396
VEVDCDRQPINNAATQEEIERNRTMLQVMHCVLHQEVQGSIQLLVVEGYDQLPTQGYDQLLEIDHMLL